MGVNIGGMQQNAFAPGNIMGPQQSNYGAFGPGGIMNGGQPNWGNWAQGPGQVPQQQNAFSPGGIMGTQGLSGLSMSGAGGNRGQGVSPVNLQPPGTNYGPQPPSMLGSATGNSPMLGSSPYGGGSWQMGQIGQQNPGMATTGQGMNEQTGQMWGNGMQGGQGQGMQGILQMLMQHPLIQNMLQNNGRGMTPWQTGMQQNPQQQRAYPQTLGSLAGGPL